MLTGFMLGAIVVYIVLSYMTTRVYKQASKKLDKSKEIIEKAVKMKTEALVWVIEVNKAQSVNVNRSNIFMDGYRVLTINPNKQDIDIQEYRNV